ncbi:MAG: hypothetical protein HRU69_03550 [Flammeovirgaceae bacterium]|nr:MAG: hypothetical protein HRU69_03550 [Flammeovirgaceae bacterium]
MNAHIRQYLFGSIFIAFGLYQLYISDYLEFWLYALAGSAFIVNALTNEPRLERVKKLLVILAWLLIVATAILFFYLLRYKFF